MQQNKKFLRVLCSLLAAALAAWCTVLLCRWVGYDLKERLGNTPSYEIINDDYSQIIDIPAEGLTQAMPLKAGQPFYGVRFKFSTHGQLYKSGMTMVEAYNEAGEQILGMVDELRAEFLRAHGQPIEAVNPTPGNKAGGITTLEDKSLGCTQKGGTAEVRDVLRYCEPVTEKGLNLVQGPGNDLCAITALMAAGAQMVLFTTGRGTPVGAPIPTVKVSTNTPLAEKKRDWIDFNAGILAQGADMQETTEVFFKKLLAIASGEQTQSEKHDYREIAIFKDGVTL